MFGISHKEIGKRAVMRGFFYILLVGFAMVVAVSNAKALAPMTALWFYAATAIFGVVVVIEYVGGYKPARKLLKKVEKKERLVAKKKRQVKAKKQAIIQTAQNAVITSVLRDLSEKYHVVNTSGPEFHILAVTPKKEEEPPQLATTPPTTSQDGQS